MSFILDALKKSEQERGLGQVPRIDTGLLVDEPPMARPSLWVALALLLAFLAVGLAIYALLRAQGQGPSVATPVVSAERSLPQSGASTLGTPATALDAPEQDDDGAAAGLRYGPAPLGAEAPRQRAAGSPVETVQSKPLPPPTSKVPADVLEDIASFKDEVLGGRQEVQDRGAPNPARSQAPANQDVRERRLPNAVIERLPAFLMTAHVYDPVPDERFVVINALRYNEGEQTREGLVVEQILPDGVLLAFEGHSFFQRR
jgi:general secretion pathway protein B